MRYKFLFICGLLAAFCGMTACKHQKKALPEENYLEFIEHIISDAYSEHPDASVFTAAFNQDAFAGRILAQGDLPKDMSDKVKTFLKEYFQPGRQMLARIDQGADYQLIHLYFQHDTARALFRVYHTTVTFEEWIMLAEKKEIAIIDVCDPISGMCWSDEWNMNACAYLNMETDHTLINEKLIRINQLIGAGEFGKADSLFSWIEQATQTNAYARAMRLNLISQSQSYDSLQTYCRQFLRQFPERRASVSFFCLQNAIANGLMPQVHRHCDELGESLGYDPIFFLYLAWGYKAAGNLPESLRMLDSLTRYIPVQYDFYNYKLDLYYDMKDAKGFALQMNRIDSLFSASEEDIPFYEKTYPEMKDTPGFKAWKNSHEQKLAAERAAL